MILAASATVSAIVFLSPNRFGLEIKSAIILAYIIIIPQLGRVNLVGNSSLPVLNGRWFEFLRVRCYRIVSLRERVELEPLDKSPVRVELSSVEILLVEGISVLKKYLISVSLLHGVQ